MFLKSISLIVLIFLCWSCQKEYDLLIRNGLIIDGSGSPGISGDLAIKDGRILNIGKNLTGTAREVIDARGQIVCPGFIDMLSWACGPIIYNGEVPSVIRQGITTAIFGEGWSMGPLNPAVAREMAGFWPEYSINYNWKTLADYLRIVEKKGTAVNIASFVGSDNFTGLCPGV